jgi:K(+)-stimulated pyrophosphate-energized sodium pump
MYLYYLLILGVGLFSIGIAGYLMRYILKQDEGNERVQKVSAYIRKGAMAFLRREFKFLSIVVVVISILLSVLINVSSAIAYVLGTVVSGLAGYVGMSIATRANSRTASAAQNSYAKALKISFSGGAVMGLCVVGFGIVGLIFVVMIFSDSHVWLAYAFGSSMVALFMRVGGGIYTKSADVGADLCGKVTAGLPEDDPGNPAVIADLVGDNVGDIAGMGSDLFESFVSAIIAAMVLGVVVYGSVGIILPLALGAAGILASIVGIFSVRPREIKTSFEQQTKHARSIMNRGSYISFIIILAVSFLLITQVIGIDIGVFYALFTGLLSGFVVSWVCEYYTTSEHKPTIGVAKASQVGVGITIIEGLSVGMISTVIPILAVCTATLVAFYFAGLFGVAIAAVGMLAILGMTLASDCYGPIADNAAGIAEMAGLGKAVRERVEALDAVGNTTAAIGKGFAISSAALAALAWLATFFEVAEIEIVNLINVNVIVGIFLGGMLAYVFCALLFRAVSSGAFAIVEEVRRQWNEIKGLKEGTATADFVGCIDLATKTALYHMVLPGALVIAFPIIVGLTLGVDAVAGLLVSALLTGFLLAIMMSNSGGAWDNAKKYIEAGNFGGKGSDAHKASVIGDTVGDPFKDTAGPSLNILIKILGIVSIMFAPLFLLLGGLL